jgi:hypothetical protein
LAEEQRSRGEKEKRRKGEKEKKGGWVVSSASRPLFPSAYELFPR